MKKIILVIFCILICSNCFAGEVSTYSEDKKFGLIENDNKLTEAKYSKLIRLGKSAWLFLYKNKYGIMDSKGEILIEPKYTQAQRLAGRFAKLGKKGLYTIIDEQGQILVGQEYSSIDLLYGQMFLVEKNYKYGLISFEGDIILAPIADDIYMPKPNLLKLLYDGVWYEIESTSKDGFLLPKDISDVKESQSFKVTSIIQNPITSTGYGIVSASDYFIKLFSSISPSYEQTIDELILGHGADTATILIKSSWLLKFPFVYGKNYINNLKAPNNGPLSDIKTNLKNKIVD